MDALTFEVLLANDPNTVIGYQVLSVHTTFYHAACLKLSTRGALQRALPRITGPIALDDIATDRLCPRCSKKFHGEKWWMP